MMNDELYEKFRASFHEIDGLGRTKAGACASVAVEVCNSIVAEVNIDEEQSGDSDFPWHLLPSEIQKVKLIAAREQVLAAYDSDGIELDEHICNLPDCPGNVIDWDQVPDKYKDSSYEDVIIERPTPPF